MTSTNPNPVSAAITTHDAERLRRLAASARTNEGRMALKLLSDMLDRQVRAQLDKCAQGRREPPAQTARLIVFGCQLIPAFLLAGGLPAQQAPTGGSPQGQAVPHLVKFSGTVKDADGKPRTGVTGITFAL